MTGCVAQRIAAGAALLGACAPLAAAPGPDWNLADEIAAAAPGSTLLVPEGTHHGPIVIDRPLRLVASGRAIIDGGGEGDVVRITAPDVTIRGFLIRNTGTSLDRENAGITVMAPRVTLEDNTLEDVLFGIYLKDAGGSVLRGNHIGGKDLDIARRGDGIRLWYSPDAIIEDNVVRESRDVVMWFSKGVQLRRNQITDGRYGLHFMYSDDNVLEDNRLESNSVGAFLMYSRNLVLRRNLLLRNRGPSGYGIGLKDMDGVDATENLFLGNRVGVYLDNSPASVDEQDQFRQNVIAFNDIGIAFQPSVQRNHFDGNAFVENLQQVAVLGRGHFRGNRFTVDGRGNYWSDYRGYDLDGDRIGDLAYRSESLFEDLMERQPKLRMFLYTPAQQAIDLASRAFPLVQPEPRFEDTAPLMQLRTIRLAPPAASTRWSTIFAAALLLGVSALVLAVGGRPWAPRRPGRVATRSPGADGC